MKFPKIAFLLLISFLFFSSCTNTPRPDDQVISKIQEDFSAYQVVQIPGNEMMRATLVGVDGIKQQEGFILNGSKTGTWLTYNAEGRIVKLESYVDGNLDGVSLNFSTREQVDQKTYYKANQLNGPNITYKFGRPTREESYLNGQLDGMVRIYDARNNVQQEIEYKNGKQDGYFRYYDEEGNMTLEYVYKNGEKVSGGMVENPQ